MSATLKTHPASHTPGPWHVEGCNDHSTVADASGLRPLAGPMSEANARLIAAAPLMLATLQELLVELDDRYDGAPDADAVAKYCGHLIAMIRPAIAAATGSVP